MKILYAVLYKELIYKRRYLLNTLFQMLLFCVIFITLFKGLSANFQMPFNYGNSIGALIVSYYAWTMMLSVYTSTGYVVMQNKQNGTLENLMCNTPYFTLYLIYESIISSVIYFILSWCIIGILSWVCDVYLYVRLVDTFIVLVSGLMSVLGLSLIIAGMAMNYRKIESIMNIIQFILLGGLFIKDTVLAKLFIPFYCANKILINIFVDGISITSFAVRDYIFLVGNSMIYMILGVCIFELCMKKAKRDGTLSFY